MQTSANPQGFEKNNVELFVYQKQFILKGQVQSPELNVHIECLTSCKMFRKEYILKTKFNCISIRSTQRSNGYLRYGVLQWKAIWFYFI